MRFQGRFIAGQNADGDGVFSQFATTYSTPHSTVDWLADDPLIGIRPVPTPSGFQVGPFRYEVQMRAVDEHGTPDGTPAILNFEGNFPPCVQCIELGNTTMPSNPLYDDIVAGQLQ